LRDDSEPAYRECGFEIIRDEDGVVLVDRGTFGLDVLAGISAALAVLVGVVGGLAQSGAVPLDRGVPSALLWPLALGLGIAAAGGWRIARRRRGLPQEDLPRRLTLDRCAGALLGRDGTRLAQLACVRVALRIDWSTRGVMRYVLLMWPDGKRVVYRSCSRRRALEVVQAIAEQGVGVRGRGVR